MTMSALVRSFAFVLATLTLTPLVDAQAQNVGPSGDIRTPSSNLTAPVDAARSDIANAVKAMGKNPPDKDTALADLTQAIQLKPDSAFAYLLRGSLYTQNKEFAQAEADFTAAERIDPKNIVIKFNLAELMFMQKHYDDARASFVPLQKDPDMGDFALYKVFLCDLFGGHEDVAKSELAAIDQKGDDASYYFAHAAWALYHKNIEDGRNWLVSASHIYEAKKFTMYGESLRYLGYLPLPPPKDGGMNPQ
jgi:tetratricopeptide (TPR) repeat protein